MIGSSTPNWLREWPWEFLNQSQSILKQNHCKCRITFDTQKLILRDPGADSGDEEKVETGGKNSSTKIKGGGELIHSMRKSTEENLCSQGTLIFLCTFPHWIYSHPFRLCPCPNYLPLGPRMSKTTLKKVFHISQSHHTLIRELIWGLPRNKFNW